MAKRGNQKQKILYILKYLKEKSDEEHPVSTQEIIDYLMQQDILADRKTIYSDIAELTDFGYDIEYKKARSDGGYYLTEQEFELPELKLLVDLVQSAKFITQKKSEAMIKKLTTFTSASEARKLSRQVYVARRIKNENESIYYAVDEIHRAIGEGCAIEFHYVFHDADKKEILRREGKAYLVSPWALTWNDECYYMIGFDHEAECIHHYRVDRMRDTKMQDLQRIGQEAFEHFDLADYCNKTFHMFAGPEVYVVLLVKNEYADVIFDRFGKDIQVHKRTDGYFTTMVPVMVSGQFFGWLSGLGSGCRIQSPIEVRNEYLSFLTDIVDGYEDISR